MANLKLTDKVIRSLPIGSFKGDVIENLYIKVNASSFSWIYKFTNPQTKGQRLKITLGRYPSLPADAARKIALDYNGLVKQGINPKEYQVEQTKKEEIDAMTFREITALFAEWRADSVKNVNDAIRRVELYIFPKFGDMPLNKIVLSEWHRALKPLENSKNDTLLKICSTSKQILDYAESCGYIENNPLTKLRSSYKKAKVKNNPTIPPEQLPEFMRDLWLSNAEHNTKIMTEFQLLTATRPNEAAKAKWAEIDLAIEAEYDLGSSLQMGVRAVTAALQGLATNDLNQAVVGLTSPYLNKAIKAQTTNEDGTINTEANLFAHAILGAIEAKAAGNNALAGAASAFTAEAAAPYIMQTLYHTENPADLTESQKQNVVNLSQIAAGLSGSLVGDSTQNAMTGAEVGKRAVENNALKILSQTSESLNSLQLRTKGEEIKEEIEEKATEEAIEAGVDAVDEYAPHYVNANADLYIIGLKGTINLRNGDTFFTGSFSPLALPSRGFGASANLGWVVNLEDSDIKSITGQRITGNTLTDKVISGTGFSIGGCRYVCLGYGKTLSSNYNDKTYKTIELGIGRGIRGELQKNSTGISLEKTIKIGD